MLLAALFHFHEVKLKMRKMMDALYNHCLKLTYGFGIIIGK